MPSTVFMGFAAPFFLPERAQIFLTHLYTTKIYFITVKLCQI
ncbi:tetR family transcriptional regulator domain protein [Acinetobacter baumannii 6112]|nr:tetR family transcriptional regulator domain protein [Acinetobacter baumannii 6112]